ncbi:hypothetical protein [Sulfurimonas sp. HSL3-7]|uniref:hypothetical protein n=1 Tax=Sulfonitrofixus jiaomeiensis TaxID=3131938 RepID=UPI0031F74FA5
MIAVILASIFISGCSQSNGYSTSGQRSTSEIEPYEEYDNNTTAQNPDDNTTADVPLVINGHVLPPEPDPAINNFTLAGVDVNKNGVRDDVERKIYLEHELEIERQSLMMSARQQQKRLEADDLIENATKWEKLDKYDIGCISYIFHEHGIDLYSLSAEDYVFNTRARVEKYIKYNQALSGGVYWTPKSYKVESSCDFNVTRAIIIDDEDDE